MQKTLVGNANAQWLRTYQQGRNCVGCVYSMPRIATPNGSGGGNIILTEKGNGSEVLNALRERTEIFSSSLYLIDIISDDGKYKLAKKIFISK